MGFLNNIFGNKPSEPADDFPWERVNSPEEWRAVLDQTKQEAVVVFKHSPRCAVSRMALSTFEKDWAEKQRLPLYIVSVIEARAASNQIATDLNVHHESPQLILLKNQKALGHWSHQSINADTLKRQLDIIGE